MSEQDHAFTPRRRRHEPGALEELGWWLWHLFVLPYDEARPWPAWLKRVAVGPVQRLAVLLGVSQPQSLRSWIHRLILRSQPAQPWSDGMDRRRPTLRHPGMVLDLLSEVTGPYMSRLGRSVGRWLDRYSGAVESSWTRANPSLRHAVVAVMSLLLVIIATTPLELRQQIAAGLLMLFASLLIRRIPRPAVAPVLMALSLIASSRYIWWRLTRTLDLNPGVEFSLGLGLLAAEVYTWTILVLGYLQNSRPLNREPVPLPDDRGAWPTVDVLIPTYNEPLAVVTPTILAALALDWPAGRLRVYVLDDGNREEFREFANRAGAHYVARIDHRHAKAGNLNHALGVTDGEFVAVFDCDHIPVRSFLTTTMGWLLRDPKCALVQTPHHFFSPDPFERNLGTFRRVPSEGDLFYGLVQDGNDLWNATFFCGSCAVLRRAALAAIGGIAEQTVTEDAHTALRLHRHGYTTAYLRQVLAGGLAAESLASHVRQRIRWARGMAQIFRVDNPLKGPGLTPLQRLCYANAMLHFFAGVPRLVFLTAPLAFLFFEFHVINAAAVTLVSYALPHLVQSAVANSHIQRRFRHSIWNEAYEAALSWYIAMPTLLALVDPRSGRFNVTAKGGTIEHEYFDWRISLPYILLAIANLIGVVVAVPRFLFWNTYEADTVVINAIWTLFNLTLLGAVLGVAAETAQRRVAQRVPKTLPAKLIRADGSAVACHTTDFSTTGMRLLFDVPGQVRSGERLRIVLPHDSGEASFVAVALDTAGNSARLRLQPMTIAEQSLLVQCTFARADVWQDWSETMTPDRPLRSLAEVLSFGATGYVRMAAMICHSAAAAIRRAFTAPAARAG
ncbi:MAG: UDP-forming cellulose synthase catalytic subunit [Steroidobacterales bacterium]